MPLFDELFQVVLFNRRQDVFLVRESGGEIEQIALARHHRVIRLPFGILFAAFVRFIQKHVPLSAVFIGAVIGQCIFLHIGNVVAAVVIHGLGITNPCLPHAAIFAQRHQLNMNARLVKLLHRSPYLSEQMLARREDENVMRRNFPVPLQHVQILNQLDHHQRLAASGGHPEAHPVDEVPVVNRVALRSDEFGQYAEYLAFLFVPLVRTAFVSFQVKTVEIAIQIRKRPLALAVYPLRFTGSPVMLFAVMKKQRPCGVFQRRTLIIVKRLLR